jgi:acetylornithine deacetylase/succinyl-diaminopimelate desuccinylase family protein
MSQISALTADNGSPQQIIHDFIQSHHAEQISFLAELVKVPTDNPPGDCARHADISAALLENMGFAVERHPVPEHLVKQAGMVSATNLVIRKRFGDGSGPVIALNAHGDVVPPGEGWTRDPYGADIIEGHMYGRGVAVSKSDFATYAYALLALQATGAALNGTVELHLTYDEEAGGIIGPQWLLEEGISKPDYAISAGFSYGVITAHNGVLHLEVTVRGKQAHAAMPHTGVDALEATNAILTALYAYRKGYKAIRSQIAGIDTPALTIGLISGGINTNVVPDRVTLRIDRRLIPDEDPALVETRLTALIEENARLPGITCEVKRILLAAPLVPVAGSERLTELLCRHASTIMGETVRGHGVPLYTDARHYAKAGIPTVLYGAGPHNILEANAHGADEHLNLEDLRKATEVVTLTLLDLLTPPVL